MLPNLRQTYFIIFAVCTSLILTALYMQHQMGLHPCPLCVTQRIFVIALGLIALVAALHNPKGFSNKIYSGLGMVAGLVGAGVSARHVWIQNLPEDQVPACGPGLEYMFETFPLFDALALLFQGDGNCADVVWSFLGLSIPAWTFVAFAGLVGLCAWQGLRKA